MNANNCLSVCGLRLKIRTYLNNMYTLFPVQENYELAESLIRAIGNVQTLMAAQY